jgi:HSP20 family protein
MSLGSWRPVVDIYENEDTVVVKAELPGVDKKDIKVDLKDGVLTLTGERSHEREVKEENYYRKERAFGRFHRCRQRLIQIKSKRNSKMVF